jgi:FkbM family methyltransferase
LTLALTEVKEFRTPRGAAVRMAVRSGTADYNNALSCLNEDEYGLASLDLGDSVALDIGAHIGGVTIALALDNPAAHVIAVEALSANIEVLRHNVEANGVGDQVTIIHGAATKPGVKSATVRWNFDANESGQHHRFIGNAQLDGTGPGEAEEVGGWSLADLPADIAFAKIDCEMCEYDVFTSPAVKRIAEIRGEYHGGFQRIADMLDKTPHVTQTGGLETTGGFRAVRR